MASEKMRVEMVKEVIRAIRYKATESGIDPTDGRVRAWIANRTNTLERSLKANDWDSAACVLMGVGKAGPCGQTDNLDEMEAFYDRICYDAEALSLLQEWRKVRA